MWPRTSWRGAGKSDSPPAVFNELTQLLDRYGYLAIFGLIGVESFGIPAPGQTVLVAAALYAGTGRLNISLVALVAFLAATIGDNIGYLIGYLGGHRAVSKYGRYVLLHERRVQRLEQTFDRHGAKLVVIARFIDGLRQFNGLVAGIAGMHWARFLAFNAIGAILWVAAWTSIGHLAGPHIGPLYGGIRRYERYVLVAVGVVIVGLVAWHVIRRRRGQPAGE